VEDPNLYLRGAWIEDSFAEAFSMRYARVIVTAHDEHWLTAATTAFSGYATSVIACDAEIGVEQVIDADHSPDGRIGAAFLIFAFSEEALAKALVNRVGQCLMTCPTTAVFDGLPQVDKRIPLGKQLRYFGDGFQKSKVIDARRYWRVPVMDGEFLVEDNVGVAKGVAGGNVILQATDLTAALAAARRGIQAIAEFPGVIAPFPGGVARSGSKVGSRYKKLRASTADAYCPTLRGRSESKLHPEANIAQEIVLDGMDEPTVAEAMSKVIHAAVGKGVKAISAGNYGGKLGKYQIRLRDILTGSGCG
jgi:formylmethanofuran--tetrahydromethanopterin N-formyltransferase